MEPEQSPVPPPTNNSSATGIETKATRAAFMAFNKWKWGLLTDPTLIGWTILLIILTVQFIKGNLMGDTTLKLELYEIFMFLFIAILYIAIFSILITLIAILVECFSGVTANLNIFTSLLTGSLQCATIDI